MMTPLMKTPKTPAMKTLKTSLDPKMMKSRPDLKLGNDFIFLVFHLVVIYNFSFTRNSSFQAGAGDRGKG